MKISVIIPTYNRIDLLRYSLDAIQKENTTLNIECIVVDDGSTDSTVEVIKKEYSWVQFYQQENKGAPAARNLGLEKAKGKYILYLDSDDLLEEGYFEHKIKLLEQNNSLAGVYGTFEYFRGDNKFEENLIEPRYTEYPLESIPSYESHLTRLVGGWFIPCNAILWRKEVLLSIGGQNEKLRVNQDVDLTFRILASKNKIAGVISGRALIRIHAGERVGVIAQNEKKLNQVYEFRNSMLTTLTAKGLASSKILENFARYCFGQWVNYKTSFPDVAFKFLVLSKQAYPKLKLQGRWYLVLLGRLIGIERAVKLKSFLSE